MDFKENIPKDKIIDNVLENVDQDLLLYFIII